MKWFPYAFCSVFIFAGLVVAVFGVVTIIRAGRSLSWPTTEGVVTTSQVVVRDGNYAPAVVFTYAVGGKAYHGTEVAIGAHFTSSDGGDAAVCANRYPVGSKVTVFFDPEAPDHSVLEPGVSKRTYLPLVFGIGFGAAGVWFCLMFWLFSG